MLSKSARRILVLTVSAPALAIALLWCYAHVDRPHSVMGYFWLEQYLVEHWPSEPGKRTIEQATPFMVRMGLLAPAVVEVPPGLKLLLDPRDLVAVNILRGGEWQPEIWNALATNLPEGSVLLDVGAHIGYFSMMGARKVGKTGLVVAFEPNPDTLITLRQNIKVNEFQNVVVAPVACADREQTLTLFAAPFMNSGASSLARNNADLSYENPPKEYSVRGRRIDDVVRELKLSRVDAIKMDIEGAEVVALRGAMETMKKFHPKIVVEVVARQLASMNSTPEELFSVLKEAGYNYGKPLTADESDWAWTMRDPGLLESTLQIGGNSAEGQLTRGFHAADENRKRWTGGKFAVTLKSPSGAGQKGGVLKFGFSISQEVIDTLHAITLSAKVGGSTLAAETFTTVGEHVYQREVPASALVHAGVEADFSLDRVLPPSKRNPFEMGVIAGWISLESR